MKSRLEIECPRCCTDSLLVREPIYEGFEKSGEILKCANCGHIFDSEDEVPFKHNDDLQVFDESDRPADPRVFSEDEGGRLCRHCANYVINPFTQWCGLHNCEVEATDGCIDFEPRTDDSEEVEL